MSRQWIVSVIWHDRSWPPEYFNPKNEGRPWPDFICMALLAVQVAVACPCAITADIFIGGV